MNSRINTIPCEGVELVEFVTEVVAEELLVEDVVELVVSCVEVAEEPAFERLLVIEDDVEGVLVLAIENEGELTKEEVLVEVVVVVEGTLEEVVG